MAVTDARIKAVMGEMSQDEGGFPTDYDATVTELNAAALNFITQQLAGQGYSSAQITSWKRLDEYNLHIAIYLLIPRVEGLREKEKGEWFDQYERYYNDLLPPRLEEMVLLDGSDVLINAGSNYLPESNTRGKTPVFRRDYDQDTPTYEPKW